MDARVTNPKVDTYVRGLLDRYDEPVLLAMEAEAAERNFPIVGRSVGVVLELLARGIGARRIFELGSGFGYSGYWFARAVGPDGEVHLTDGDPDNEAKALRYLGEAGLDPAISYHVGEAIEALGAAPGNFDIVYCDIDKHDYPKAWQAARDRIRPGGMYVSDNTLAWGSATILEEGTGSDVERIQAVRAHNDAIAADSDFVTTILPIRDGVMVSLRLA